MADEETTVAGRRRSRGSNAAVRAEALERLKAIRSGGRRSGGGGFQIKIEDPIYDTVEEDEYEALVAKRREEARGFIIDDDGLGYGDEGQEEDWSEWGAPVSSDESDGEAERPKRKKREKKDHPPKKPSALSAAASLMGKQRLSNMFTSSVFKKNRDDKAKNLSSDSLVDDVIAEFAPDEADRERRRRGQAASLLGGKSFSPIDRVTSIKSEKPLVNGVNLMVRPAIASASTNGDFLLGNVQKHDMIEEKESSKECENDKDLNIEIIQEPDAQHNDSSIKESAAEQTIPSGLERKAEMPVKEEGVYTLNAKVKEDRDPALSAIAGWQAVRSAGNGTISCEETELNSSYNGEEKPGFLLDCDGSLPFYILDAYEEVHGANIGNLYLFGKVNYQSILGFIFNFDKYQD